MMAQTHAALWWRQCIPACLHLRATRILAQRRFRLMNGQWMALQDGTEMIEKTLKLSLALLERRERIRAGRKAHPRGRSRPWAASAAPPRSVEAMSFGGRFDLPTFYREFEDVYRRLYEIYGICNYHGWGGTLPPVAYHARSGNALSRPCREDARMHDKSASFIERDGLCFLQDDA